MKSFYRAVFALALFPQTFFSQTNTQTKLVVGIVVDQMRNDFIYRYWDRFSEGGFKRLVNEGFYFKNTHFNYIPTYTGPGHASIYTGTTPRNHGIIANDWYVKKDKISTYCVQDGNAKTIGSESNRGKASPKNLLSSTIGDELKMNTNQKGKVFAVCLKDRGAILPAGHAADGAFWFDDETGNFISSDFYMNELPKWLQEFNNKKLVPAYLAKGWNTLYPINTYINSISDKNDYEFAPYKNEATFPYEFSTLMAKNKFGTIKATPYGNSITKDIAMACLKNENLGQDQFPDLLAISFSSPDIIGHNVGPRAVEIEDTYLRLDKDIAEILKTLDETVGKNNYLVFLTADHGGADVPNHLLQHKIPAGYLNEKKINQKIKIFLNDSFGDSLLLADLSNDQIFLNEERIVSLKLDKNKIEESLCVFLLSIEGVAEAYPSQVIKNAAFSTVDFRSLIQNGFNHKMSGNVCFIYQSAWMDHAEKGTTHGSAYNYDTHVPMIFYGSGIKSGENFNYTTITQIAPTVCELLRINHPNACTTEPLNNYFK